MSNREHAFGIDVSRYQGLIDWDQVVGHREPTVIFAAMRAGISWGYTDGWFARNRTEAKARNLIWLAYHVLYPGEDASRQMDHFFRILGDDIGPMPLVIDAELDHGQSRRTITNRILECARIIEQRAGRAPILYGRAEWINRCTYPKELAHLDLWVAQYLSADPDMGYAREHMGPPDLPKGFEQYLIHQTGDKTPGAGFGVQSKYLDYNRWNGDAESVYRYMADGPGELPGDEPELPGDGLARLQMRVAVPILNVREGPGLQYRDIGDLDAGQVLDVLNVAGDGAWIEFAPGQWCAASARGKQYCVRVD